MIRPVALLAALSIALAGCKTPEQTVVDRRRELRATLDRMYAEYAGAEKPAEGADSGLLGHLAGQVDRAYFENECLARGRGERGINLSPRLDAFLAEDRNARACREAADLAIEIDELERKIAARRR